MSDGVPAVATPARGPIMLVDVELSRPLLPLVPSPAAMGGAYRDARILATLHARPLGVVDLRLPPVGLDAALIADAIWAQLAGAVREHLVCDGLAVPERLGPDGLGPAGQPPCSWRAVPGPNPASATVVISTCGGYPSRLTETVGGALAQTYPCFEVVVVDNRPDTSAVRTELETAFPGEHRVRYVAEPLRGLAHARNRGASVAQGEIVAFTDDDVVLDPDWLAWLVVAFDDPLVACVTGLIIPHELETDAQLLLDEFCGYAKGFERRIWDAADCCNDPLFPYRVGAYGSGANGAFRRDALAELGGFDPALGAGSLARGGEDLDIFLRCIQRGHRLVYEPAAIVRHAHDRWTRPGRKVFDYGVGLGAMLAKQFLTDRSTAAALLARVPQGMVHLLSAQSAKNASKSAGYPRSLVLTELTGLAYGPVAYLRSRHTLDGDP